MKKIFGLILAIVTIVTVSTSCSDEKTSLTDNANLAWNICTQADQMMVESVDNTVFFVMSPLSFEE